MVLMRLAPMEEARREHQQGEAPCLVRYLLVRGLLEAEEDLVLHWERCLADEGRFLLWVPLGEALALHWLELQLVVPVALQLVVLAVLVLALLFWLGEQQFRCGLLVVPKYSGMEEQEPPCQEIESSEIVNPAKR